jgi:hypothetical protein
MERMETVKTILNKNISVTDLVMDLQVQKIIFRDGVNYGRILHEELLNKRVFAPFSLISLPVAERFSPYVMFTFDDNMAFIKYGMRTFINKGTAYYIIDLFLSLNRTIGGPFKHPEFKEGMMCLIEDLGGYDGSKPVVVIPDIMDKDLITVTYNTDAHWVDYARTAMFNYVPYIIITNAVIDILGLELFSFYREYALHRENSSEQARRVAGAIFAANSRMHRLLYGNLEPVKEEYRAPGFVSAIKQLNDNLMIESARALNGLDYER